VVRTDKSSMLYWWPKIKDLGVPKPKTVIVEINLNETEIEGLCDGHTKPLLDKHGQQIKAAIDKFGFPLFLRTDLVSNKHGWKKSCYVESLAQLPSHVGNVVEFSLMCDMMGLPVKALIFREYVPMKNLFRAFHGEMPVNPEIRFFALDGELLCWHWYWIKEAIQQGTEPELLPKDWKKIIEVEKNSANSTGELMKLCAKAFRVAQKFKGFWSIDFCKAADNKWYLIDMAEGYRSWHPECDFAEMSNNPRK
jgi:ATP-grasp domain, R2K clade family 3